MTIFEANSTPIVCEERMRPKGVSGWVGEGERGRITFVFYEAVQHAGSVGFVRLRSLSWRGGGRGRGAYFPQPLGPSSMTLAK